MRTNHLLNGGNRGRTTTTRSVQMNLAYWDMNIAADGMVMNNDQIREARLRQGFCTECPGRPIRLYNISRARFNPLWSSKEPITADGQVFNGQCLLCHPELNPKRRNRRQQRRPQPNNPNNNTRDNGRRRSSMSDIPTAPRARPRFSQPNLETVSEPLGAEDSHQSDTYAMSAEPSGNENAITTAEVSFQHQPLEAECQVIGTDHFHSSAPAFIDVASHSSSDSRNDRESPMIQSDEVSDTSNQASESSATEGTSDDYLEIMHQRCHQRSSMRMMRQSSLNNVYESDSPQVPALVRRISRNTINRSRSPSPPQTHQRRSPNFPDPSPPPPRAVSPVNDETLADPNVVVMELESLIKDLSGAGNPDFTADILINAMKEYRDAIPVQLYCLGTIWDLCKDNDSYKSSLISTSAPEDILTAMRTHVSSADIQERGCGALWSLSIKEENRIIVIRAGAPARIVKAIIEHMDDSTVVRTAIGALRTLSPESEARESMGALQAMKQVCSAMQKHRSIACIQRDGCAFLSNSAVDLEKQQVALASEYELNAVVDAMIEHRNEPSVMAGACFALKNYTYDERNLRMLGSIANIEALLEHASHSEDRGAKADAAIVLDRLKQMHAENESLEEQARRSMIDLVERHSHSSNVVVRVLDIMADYEWSAKLISGGLQCLGSLATEAATHREQITDSVLTKVVMSMNKFVDVPSVQVNACHLLEAMANSSSSSRRAILRARGCHSLVTAMDRHRNDLEVQISATAVIRALSLEFDCWFELEKTVGPSLQEAMGAHPNSSLVQANATDILTNFSRHAVH